MNITKGTRVRIIVGARAITGVVAQVYCAGPDWDLEYNIVGRAGAFDPARGNYGRWRQLLDGGSVEVLP